MVAESMARNDETDAKRVFQTAISFLAVIGLAGSIILFVFAKQLAGLVGIPDAELGIKSYFAGSFLCIFGVVNERLFSRQTKYVPNRRF